MNTLILRSVRGNRRHGERDRERERRIRSEIESIRESNSSNTLHLRCNTDRARL